MEPVVRPALHEDAGGITEVHVRAWQVAYRGIFPDRYLDELGHRTDERRRRWEKIIAAPDLPATVTLVSEREGQVTGWASHGPSRDSGATKDTGELYGIYVHPDRWRAGTGTALMTTATEQMAATGFTEATLWVLEDNTRARKFYERLGWREDGATDIFERDGAQAIEVRYRRALKPASAGREGTPAGDGARSARARREGMPADDGARSARARREGMPADDGAR